jgi:hypothetical protein
MLHLLLYLSEAGGLGLIPFENVVFDLAYVDFDLVKLRDDSLSHSRSLCNLRANILCDHPEVLLEEIQVCTRSFGCL